MINEIELKVKDDAVSKEERVKKEGEQRRKVHSPRISCVDGLGWLAR